jgi:preprotein translocase subunit SecA
MFREIIKKIFSSANEREIAKISKVVETINELEKVYLTMSDEGLKEQTTILKSRLKAGETLDDILPNAFAVVREAAKRTLKIRAFDVQLIGAVVLHRGQIAEMKTGEGKTFVAVFSSYLNALTEKGVHIVTVNDYLAKRDSEWMGVVHNFLGLSVGCILQNMSDEDRRLAYNCDITYGTNSEFGFDYLRDNMKVEKEDLYQRDFNYVIIDEVDSILIDEARTPLIISGATEDNSKLYIDIDNIVKRLSNDYCSIDEKEKTVVLTEEGTEYIEKILKLNRIIVEDSSLYDISNIDIVHHVDQALKAHKLFKNEVDYMVKDGQVYIVDEFTGRIMDGRRFSDGLHQALEAKEGVQIQNENQTLASITYQNYFRMYPKMAGMTGTAATEATEFEYIYNLRVIEIPPNVKIQRIDEDDVIYKTEFEKYRAIITQIKDCYQKKQPVLVGTVSIERSELVSRLLKAEKIPHNVLNAKYHEKEAFIIAQAGKPSAITIATNMAGRGTDIKLGGSIDFELKEIENNQNLNQAEKNDLVIKLKNKLDEDRQIVLDAGGLYILGTERHESRRIDNQLRGRSGRQGDIGRSKFFISLQDDLMRIFGSEKISNVLTSLGLKDDEAIVHPWISKSLERAQQKVENMHYEARKNVLKYDDVLNTQRKVIFEQRKEIIFANDISPEIDYIIEGKNRELIERYLLDVNIEKWDLDGLDRDILDLYGLNTNFSDYVKNNLEVNSSIILNKLNEIVKNMLDEKSQLYGEDVVNRMKKHIFLITIDRFWKEHLHILDKVRQGIGLRAYGQKDPLLEYKKEAFDLFEVLLYNINETTLKIISKAKINVHDDLVQQIQNRKKQQKLEESRSKLITTMNIEGGNQQNTVKNGEKVGRNDPCPCGSGKKYKHCCGQ